MLGDHLDRFDLVSRRMTNGAMIDRERSDHCSIGPANWRRPAGPEAVGKREMSIVRPKRIRHNVTHIDRPTEIGGGSAGTGAWPDFRSINGIAIGFGKSRRGTVRQPF